MIEALAQPLTGPTKGGFGWSYMSHNDPHDALMISRYMLRVCMGEGGIASRHFPPDAAQFQATAGPETGCFSGVKHAFSRRGPFSRLSPISPTTPHGHWLGGSGGEKGTGPGFH